MFNDILDCSIVIKTTIHFQIQSGFPFVASSVGVSL